LAKAGSPIVGIGSLVTPASLRYRSPACPDVLSTALSQIKKTEQHRKIYTNGNRNRDAKRDGAVPDGRYQIHLALR
jgi:hypothetical protein